MDSRLLAQLLRGKLEKSPLLQADAELEPLPPIDAPDLEDLHAEVTLPPVPSEDSLFVPRWRIMRELGQVTERARGESVQAGDEVRVGLVGYAAGWVMPFSAVGSMWLDPETDTALPGLRDALIGVPIGGRKEVEVLYPEDHPETFLRGQRVVYAVSVQAAQGVKPASLSDPRVLAALEVKSLEQLEEVMAAWVVDAYEERCVELIRGAAMAAFAGRLAAVPIPDAVVDADIKKRWHADEGAVLKARSVPLRLQERALETWLENPELRAEVTASYRIALGLAALVASGQVTVSAEDGLRFLAAWAAEEGVAPEEALESFKDASEADLRALDEMIARTKAIEYVLERTDIQVETALEQ